MVVCEVRGVLWKTAPLTHDVCTNSRQLGPGVHCPQVYLLISYHSQGTLLTCQEAQSPPDTGPKARNRDMKMAPELSLRKSGTIRKGEVWCGGQPPGLRAVRAVGCAWPECPAPQAPGS